MIGSFIEEFYANTDGWARADLVRRAFDQLWLAGRAEELLDSLPREHRSRFNHRGRLRAIESLVSVGDFVDTGSPTRQGSPDQLSRGAMGELLLLGALDAAAHNLPSRAESLVSAASECFAADSDPRHRVRNLQGVVAAAIASATILQRFGLLSQAAEAANVPQEVLDRAGAIELAHEIVFRQTAIEITRRGDVTAQFLTPEVDDQQGAEIGLVLFASALAALTRSDDDAGLQLLEQSRRAFAREATAVPRFRAATAAATLAVLALTLTHESAEHVDAVAETLLDQLLSFRASTVGGPLAAQVSWLTDEIITCASLASPGRRHQRSPVRAAVEFRQAAVETLLLRPTDVQVRFHEKFPSLLETFQMANDRTSAIDGLPPIPLQEVRIEFAREFPLFADLAAPSALDIGALRAALAYSWLLLVIETELPDETVRWHSVAVGPDGTTSTQRFRLEDADLDHMNEIRYERESWSEWWTEMSSKILPEELLSQVTMVEPNDPLRLTIVASGVMAKFPFGALRLSPAARLVDNAILNMLPSARLLSTKTLEWSTVPHVVASWSGTVKHEADERRGWSSMRARARSSEIGGIGELVAVLERDVPDLIHLSGHGRNSGGGFNQSIDLPGATELTALEALGLRWPKAVTMSACHVAHSERVDRGSGVVPDEYFGFAHACFAGGAEQLIGGTDRITSESTARLLGDILASTDFDEVLDLPAALRHAQRANLHPSARAIDWAMIVAMAKVVPQQSSPPPAESTT